MIYDYKRLLQEIEDYKKDIYNAALEDAALTAEKYEANMIAYEIRMRKKK